MKNYLILGGIAFVAVFMGQLLSAYITSSRPNNVSKFNVKEEMIARDLDGRVIQLAGGQVWPLDSSQNIRVKVEGKKPLDEYVVVIVEVSASAQVQQETPAGPKEQFSTTPNSKDVPKTQKLPTKLQLKGMMKLTYELVDSNWYLIGAEGLGMKAYPLD
jgi:hypothetical protein